MFLSEEKVFKDPIHQYIYVKDKIIWDLINSSEFQRLRRIKQLGTTYFTFHGAEHSRFSHSLGVYEITRKIISMFNKNNYSNVSYEEEIIALIAALLHDIGHGPFSHSIENAFNFEHENWSKDIIAKDTEVNKILNQVDEKLPSAVVDVLSKNGKYPILESIISSQLDADRMDYLLRDAYYTGVKYGTYDLERILRVIRPYDKNLVIKESGMHSVEDYLMSRYQMYWQVYFHPVTRSGEIILKKIFNRAKEIYSDGKFTTHIFNPLKNLFNNEIDVKDFNVLDDSLIYTQLYLWSLEKDKILSDLSLRFLNRKLFKYVDINIEITDEIEQIKDMMINKSLNPEYYLEIDSPSDLPYDIYQPNSKNNNCPIYLLQIDNSLIEISKRSEIISSIIGKKKTKKRLYYPEEAMEYKFLIKLLTAK